MGVITPLTDNPQPLFEAFVLHWFKLLAYGEFERACSMVDEPNSYGMRWTPDHDDDPATFPKGEDGNGYRKGIKPLVEEIMGPNVTYSDPDSVTGEPDMMFDEFEDGSGYWFHCQMPVDGEWSDITALFEFMKRSTGYAVILDDLHVL